MRASALAAITQVRKLRLMSVLVMGLAWTSATGLVLAQAADDTPAKKTPLERATQPPAKPKRTPLERAVDPLAGVFTNEEFKISVELTVGKGGQVTGVFAVQEVAYALKSQRTGDRLTGQYTGDGDTYPFTAQLTGDTLNFTSGDATIKLIRQKRVASTKQPVTGAAPVRKPNTAVAVPPNSVRGSEGAGLPQSPHSRPSGAIGALPAPDVGSIGMRTSRHASGLNVRFPGGWRDYKQKDGSLALIPDDVERDLDGRPLEFVRVAAIRAAAGEQPWDAGAAEAVDFYVKSKTVDIKRVGDAEMIDSIYGRGAVYRYQGALNKKLGGAVDVYVIRHGEQWVFVIHLGPRELVIQRRPAVLRLFRELGWESGQLRAQLVGSWVQVSTEAVAPAGSGRGERLRTERLEFRKDGTCRREVTAADRTAAGTTPPDPEARSNERRGQWAVIHGRLYFLWSNQESRAFRFQLTGGGTLELMSDGQRSVTFKRP